MIYTAANLAFPSTKTYDIYVAQQQNCSRLKKYNFSSREGRQDGGGAEEMGSSVSDGSGKEKGMREEEAFMIG